MNSNYCSKSYSIQSLNRNDEVMLK